MKNKYFILALALSCSSCGIFRNSSKQKSESSLDSTGSKTTKSSLIDTSKYKNYEKISFYFQPGSPDLIPDRNLSEFASGLFNAARGLAEASRNLQDSTFNKGNLPGVNISKPGVGKFNSATAPYSNGISGISGITGIPGLTGFTLERTSEGKNGISLNQSDEQKTEKNEKAESSLNVKTPDGKMWLSIGVILIFGNIVFSIFAFLYLKSR